MSRGNYYLQWSHNVLNFWPYITGWNVKVSKPLVVFSLSILKGI